MRTGSSLDWKIWFVVFAVLAGGIAVFVNRDMQEQPEVDLATDDVQHSINSHTDKNRKASDTLASILER